MGKYYDGHYINSQLELSEIERILKEEEEKIKQLTDWPDELE